MPRVRQLPQSPPTLDTLLRKGITRERALLASRVGQLRWEHQWNWRDLGRIAGVHPKLVEDLEAGQRDVQFSTLVKLARGLGLHSLDELLVILPLTMPHTQEADADFGS